MTTQHTPSSRPDATSHPEKEAGRQTTSAQESILDRTSEAAHDMADQASKLSAKAIEQGKELGDMASRAPNSVRDAVGGSLREQPIATLAVAAALGFALGALWKS